MSKKDAAPEEAPAGTVAPETRQEPAPADSKVAPADQTRTPNQWANVLFPASERGRINKELWKHGAAQALHHWNAHEHHAGAPMQLTRAQYEAAIKAATTIATIVHPEDSGVDGPKRQVSTYLPHIPALASHLKKGG